MATELTINEMVTAVSKKMAELGCKLVYRAGSEGSLYYSLVTTCDNEYEIFHKLRFSDHERREAGSASNHLAPEWDFVEGCDFDGDLAMLVEQVEEELKTL